MTVFACLACAHHGHWRVGLPGNGQSADGQRCVLAVSTPPRAYALAADPSDRWCSHGTTRHRSGRGHPTAPLSLLSPTPQKEDGGDTRMTAGTARGQSQQAGSWESPTPWLTNLCLVLGSHVGRHADSRAADQRGERRAGRTATVAGGGRSPPRPAPSPGGTCVEAAIPSGESAPPRASLSVWVPPTLLVFCISRARSLRSESSLFPRRKGVVALLCNAGKGPPAVVKAPRVTILFFLCSKTWVLFCSAVGY